MPSINYLYNVNQEVWNLNEDKIEHSKILEVEISVSQLNILLVRYKIKNIKTNHVNIVDENSLYENLSGVGSALEAYETQLLS